MIEWVAPGFVYSVLKDAWHAARGRQRRLTPAQVLELRQKWKPLFEEKVWKNHTQRLRKDVVIRDVKRMDNYPNVDARANRISSWFRVGLVGTYYRGILVGLRWGKLAQYRDTESWRFLRKHESGGIGVTLIGRIRYEHIETVDWDGDEYYQYPHIYCYFDAKKREPYEDLLFCHERCNPGGLPFYPEIASYESVQILSRRLRIDQSF